MNYESYAEEQLKTELGTSYKLANKNKNLAEIESLANKGLVFAIEKMIEFHAKNKDNKQTGFIEKLIQAVPEELKLEAIDKANNIVHNNTPKHKLSMSH